MQERRPLSRPQSLTDAVVMYVRDAVTNGELAPGQQLSEANLAQTLGTSRGTVREAMRVLANLGLVSRSAHRGPVVTLITPVRAHEIYTMRDLLESTAARMAAEGGRIDPFAMAMLEQRLQTMAEAARSLDVGGMVEADMQFHRSLSALSGHELLLEHLAAIYTHTRRLLVYSDLYESDFGVVVERHAKLLKTVATGDPDAIQRAVSNHITEVGHNIVAKMMAGPPPTLPARDGGNPAAGGSADGSRAREDRTSGGSALLTRDP
jgi:DNA-binding GntR family transcriptional regulator